MGRLRLKETLLVLGIVLIVISFIPGPLVSEFADIEEGTHHGYLFQCVTSPHITVEVRHSSFVSVFILSLEDSFRLIDGEPIENITVIFSLVNISEYSGTPDLGAPGQYVIFITTLVQSNIVFYSVFISRSLPHFWVLMSGVFIFSLDVFVYLFQLLKARNFIL